MSLTKNQQGFAATGALISFVVLVIVSAAAVVTADRVNHTTENRTKAFDQYNSCPNGEYACLDRSTCVKCIDGKYSTNGQYHIADPTKCGAPCNNGCGSPNTCVAASQCKTKPTEANCPNQSVCCPPAPTSTPTSSPTSTPTSSPTSTPTSSPTSTPTCISENAYCGQGAVGSCCSGLSCTSNFCKRRSNTECTSNSQCATGRCVKEPGQPTGSCKQKEGDGGRCSASNECISNYCDNGSCKTRPVSTKEDGASCSNNSECQSQNCQLGPSGKKCIPAGKTYVVHGEGESCDNKYVTCKSPYVCPQGTCRLIGPPAPPPQSGGCSGDSDCQYGKCVKQTGAAKGMCQPVGVGASCDHNYDCQTGKCQNSRCIFSAPEPPQESPIPCKDHCLPVSDCSMMNMTSALGKCAKANYSCCKSTSPSINTSSKPEGASCSNNSECQSQNCQLGPSGKKCIPAGKTYVVHGEGESCDNKYVTCKSPYVCPQGTCRLIGPPAPPPQSGGCSGDSDCQYGKCVKTSGLALSGICTPIDLGGGCDDNRDCKTGTCQNSRCILGSNGTTSAPSNTSSNQNACIPENKGCIPLVSKCCSGLSCSWFKCISTK